MRVEAAVLIGLEQGEIEWVDVVDRGLQSPLAVGRGEGAQQPAVGIDGLARPLLVARQVRRKDPVQRQRARRQAGGGERDADEDFPSSPRLAWGGVRAADGGVMTPPSP